LVNKMNKIDFAPAQREYLISLDAKQLIVHPRNMRRVYALRDMRRMGLSQLARARTGQPACVQPLIVTRLPPGPLAGHPGGRPDGKYVVIAGHLRRAGNLWLGERRPKLNCIVRPYANESSILSDMGTENGVRADVGPISWALYYRGRLADGVNARVLARECGVTVAKMNLLLSLLGLADRVQQFVEAGDLSLSHARVLLRVEHLPTQTKLALRAVQRCLTAEALEQVVRHWLETHTADGRARPGAPEGMTKITKPNGRNGHNGNGRHSPELSRSTPSTEGLPVDLPVHLAELRVMAAKTCADCDIGQGLPGREQAWHLALAEAGETCKACDLKAYKDACRLCPLAQMMAATVKHFVPEAA
jgi:ParB-like chromosome segregation protein Spo0J